MTLLFNTVLSLSLTSIYSQTLRYRLSGTTAETGDHGRFEVYHKHRWRAVCDDTFGDIEASVVCFSLGFPRNCGRVVDNWHGSALGRALRTDIRCEGSESSLADCRYGLRSQDDVTASHHCTQSVNHVAVSCQQCHAITRRSRRNPLMPYSSNAGASSSNSGGSSTFWMGGLFIFFFFAWVVVVTCCIICHCCRHRRLASSQNGSQAQSQGVFMTSASGAENAGMSSSTSDGVHLAGLPSYEDVIAHSDIYKRIEGDSLPPYSVASGQQSAGDQDNSERQT